MFGVVGAYSWSGGIMQDLTHQMLNSSFINATNMEEDIKDSYLGMVPFFIFFIITYGVLLHILAILTFKQTLMFNVKLLWVTWAAQ